MSNDGSAPTIDDSEGFERNSSELLNAEAAAPVSNPICASPHDHLLMRQQGCVVWFTGMSSAGKTTAASILERRLRRTGAHVEVLDGDVIRTRLSRGLGFAKEDRDENIRRIGFVCELLSRNGVIVIVSAISPYRAARDEVRGQMTQFVEVYMECPLDVLIGRDVKGLYRRAMAGEISRFTGISDPYEPPLAPEVIIYSDRETPEEGVEKVWRVLSARGLLIVA